MRCNNAESRIGTLVPRVRARLMLIAGLLALLVASGCSGGSTSANGGGNGQGAASVRGTIKVGTAPIAIAVDSTANKIYVTDSGTQPTGVPCSPTSADFETIDGATQSTTSVGLLNDIPGGAVSPYAAALNPANHTLYVLKIQYWAGIKGNGDCEPLEYQILAFDTTSWQTIWNAQFPTIITKNFPARIEGDPTTGTIYVTRGGAVDVWDSNFNFVAMIPVGSAPVGVAVNATSNKIYIANGGSNDVSVIDGTSNSVIATIADPNAVSPVAVAVNPTTNTIYEANSGSNNLSVIDGATNTVTATIPVGTSPSGVAVESQTNFIYVANAGNSQNGSPGNVTVINGMTNAPTTLSDPSAKNPVAVAANSVTNTIYVANSGSNNVTVINGAHD